jgi:hypothetical protein
MTLLNNMLDFGWFYAIVGSSATFVAIVSAFFTTKILAIASEKRQLLIEIASTNKEIDERTKLANLFQEEIGSIHLKWAKRDVNPFLEVILFDVAKSGSIPTLEELIEKFTDKEGAPDEYEKKVLKEKYGDFVEQAKVKIAEERQRVNSRFTIFSPLSMAALPVLPPTLNLTQIVMRERERLDDVTDKFSEETNRLKILENQKEDRANRLKAVYLPKYIGLSFAFLIYFIIVGVALPLAYVSWGNILSVYVSEPLIYVLFLSGLGLNVIYLYLEVRQALKEP